MTPRLGRDQSVSSALAYAVGCGRAVVSTPYPYALELLAEGRGLLSDFEDAASLGKNISFLLEHPEKRREMEEKAARLGASMGWRSIANRYIKVCFKVFSAWLKQRESTR